MAKEASSPPETEFPEKYYNDPMGMDRYVVQEKLLFEWKAPSKPEHAHQISELAQYVLGIILIALILILIGEWLLMVVIVTAGFLYLAAMVSPATLLTCRVTTIGLKIEERYFYWTQLTQFWFETQRGTRYVYVRDAFSGMRLVRFIIRSEDEQTLKTTIGRYLLYKKPQQSTFEKFLQRLQEKLPPGTGLN